MRRENVMRTAPSGSLRMASVTLIFVGWAVAMFVIGVLVGRQLTPPLAEPGPSQVPVAEARGTSPGGRAAPGAR